MLKHHRFIEPWIFYDIDPLLSLNPTPTHIFHFQTWTLNQNNINEPKTMIPHIKHKIEVGLSFPYLSNLMNLLWDEEMKERMRLWVQDASFPSLLQYFYIIHTTQIPKAKKKNIKTLKENTFMKLWKVHIEENKIGR